MSETLTTFCQHWAAFMAGQIAIIVGGYLWIIWRERRRKARSVARVGDPSWRYRQTSGNMISKPKAPGSH